MVNICLIYLPFAPGVATSKNQIFAWPFHFDGYGEKLNIFNIFMLLLILGRSLSGKSMFLQAVSSVVEEKAKWLFNKLKGNAYVVLKTYIPLIEVIELSY